jgi:hypothetical protein
MSSERRLSPRKGKEGALDKEKGARRAAGEYGEVGQHKLFSQIKCPAHKNKHVR